MGSHYRMTYVTAEDLKTLPIQQLIAYRLKNLRIQKCLTQEELAFEAGVDRSYIGQIERCEKNVTVVTLQKIAKSFDLDLLEFLDFTPLIDRRIRRK